MAGMLRKCGVILMATVVVASAAVMGAAGPARAADGDTLRQIEADRGGCGLGTGIAFDGTNLLLSCSANSRIDVIDPGDGHLVASHEITGSANFGALAWDRGRGQMWACSGFGSGDGGGASGDEQSVYLVDLVNNNAELKFRSQGCVDGLAYDGSDDSLWSSADVATTVQHYSIDGTTLPNGFSVDGQLGTYEGGGEGGGGNCGNSGIAVGGQLLLLSNNGCSQVYKAAKSDIATSPDGPQPIPTSLFATFPARLEDMECDDITFAADGKAAIWTKDAYDDTLNAFELNPGDCGYGGYSAAFTLSPVAAHPTPGSTHTVTARLRDVLANTPVEGMVIDFVVTAGPNAGTTGTCAPSSCATQADGTVTWSYLGDGGNGTDTIVAFIDQNNNGSPEPAEPRTSASAQWQTTTTRTIVVLGGIGSNSRSMGGAGFPYGDFIDGLASEFGEANVKVFSQYQDSSYRSGSSCTSQPGPDAVGLGDVYLNDRWRSTFNDPPACDSNGPLALSASALDDFLNSSSIPSSGPITLVSNSMGGAIVRGWLALDHHRLGHTAGDRVDSSLFIQGAHDGSYLAIAGSDLGAGVALGGPLVQRLNQLFADGTGIDVTRAAVHDLEPVSSWYRSVNSKPVPDTKHYFNLFSSIDVAFEVKVLWGTQRLGSIDAGDLVLLPGSDNPNDTPLLGGARFLPFGENHGQRQYRLPGAHVVTLDMEPCYIISVPGFCPPDIADRAFAQLHEVLSDPVNHAELSGLHFQRQGNTGFAIVRDGHDNMNTGRVTVNSCAGGTRTPQAEIIRIIHDPGHACP
jgi:hypothetical protein